MNTINDLFTFVNLFSIASLYHSSYQMQEKLVVMCRIQKRPFFYQLLTEHQFHCTICGHHQCEVIMHFEDPNQPIGSSVDSPFCLNPAGRFYDISRSILHGILTHGNSMPVEFMELLAGAESQSSFTASQNTHAIFQTYPSQM